MSATLALPVTKQSLPSPAAGFAGYYWRMNRVPLAVAIGMSALMGVIMRASNADPSWRTVALIPLMQPLLAIMVNFAGISITQSLKGTGYPRMLLRLPVRTGDLVLWPMVYGALTVTSACAACAVLIGLGCPPVWFFAWIASIMVWTQVANWLSSNRVTFAGAILAFALVALLAAGPIAAVSGADPRWIAAGNIALVVSAFVAGLRRVLHERRGDTVESTTDSTSLWQRLTNRTGADLSRPLQSPLDGQSWIDIHGHSLSLDRATLDCTVVLMGLSLPLLLIDNPTPLAFTFPTDVVSGVGAILTSMWTKAMTPFLIFVPVVMSGLCGGGMRVEDTRKNDYSLNSLFATRPLTTSDLIAIRLRVAVRGTLAGWCTIVPAILVWALSPAEDHGMKAPIGLLLCRYMTIQDAPSLVAAALLALYMTWRLTTDSLFVAFASKAWVVWSGIMCPAVLLAIGALAGPFAMTHPATAARVIAHLPELTAIWAGLKLAGMALVAKKNAELGIYTSRRLGAIAIAWLAVSILVGLCVAAVGRPFGLSTWMIVAATFILMPGLRLGLAPLALYWNRHR